MREKVEESRKMREERYREEKDEAKRAGERRKE